MGMMLREYTTLCHGLLGPHREVTVPVFWRRGEADASAVRPEGRRARSSFRRLGFTFRRQSLESYLEGYSLAEIRIGTGRRHQIRLHAAHIGHPTVADGKYTAGTTFEDDLSWCPRNFLHRHRLCFKESVCGAEHSVVEPLPKDLYLSLNRTRPDARFVNLHETLRAAASP